MCLGQSNVFGPINAFPVNVRGFMARGEKLRHFHERLGQSVWPKRKKAKPRGISPIPIAGKTIQHD
jgi:hypothetical protein